MMNAEMALKLRFENPDFKCMSGSRLYGTNTPTSDVDIRGFTFVPFEYVFDVKQFVCAELEGDHKIFNVMAFLHHVLKGDPQCTELLYAPKSMHLQCNAAAQEILDLRSDIVSMNIYARILGYSNSEWRKARGEKIEVEKMPKTIQQLLDEIRVFRPDLEKAEMDTIVEILTQNLERKVVSSVGGLGSKRKAQVEKFGFCTSSASHCIRLVTQLYDLIRYGEMTFPLPNADLCRDIKLGKYDLKTVSDIYEEYVAKVEESKPKSVLPQKPNREKVWETYVKLTGKDILEDRRFKELMNI